MIAFLLAQVPWYFMIHGDIQNYDHRPLTQPNEYGRYLLNTMVWTSATFNPPPVYLAQVGDFTSHASDEEFVSNKLTFDMPGLPWGACPGNHDYANQHKANGLISWRRVMGEPRRADVMQTPDGQVAFIHVGYCPDDTDVAFAYDFIDANPTTPVVLVTHYWLERAEGQIISTRLPPNTAVRGLFSSAYGLEGDMSPATVWTKLIEPCPSIFFVACGHVSNRGWRADSTRFGTEVQQHLVNWQNDPWGGNGFQTGVAFFGRTMLVVDFSVTYPIRRYGQDWTFAEAIQLRESVAELRARLSARPTWRSRTAIDSWVYSQWGGGGSRCTDAVQFATGPDWQEVGLLKFDLTGSPSTPRSAMLQLAFEAYQGDSVHGFSIHILRRDVGSCPSWAGLGGLIAGRDYDSSPIFSVGEVGRGVVNVDVTTAVQYWTSNPNHGFAFVGRGSDAAAFRSSRSPVADRPMLVIQ